MDHHKPSVPIPSGDIAKFSPGVWAYVGDAVYELFVRTRCLYPPSRLKALHHRVVNNVRAESQAQIIHLLIPHLTPPELEVVRKGRNSASGKPKRVKLSVYQQATGLEALLGYLYLTDPQRLEQVLSQVSFVRDESTDLPMS